MTHGCSSQLKKGQDTPLINCYSLHCLERVLCCLESYLLRKLQSELDHLMHRPVYMLDV